MGLLLVSNDMEEVKVFIQEWPNDSWGIPQLGVDGLAGFKVNQAIETLRMQHAGLPSITHDLVGELRGVEMDTRRTISILDRCMLVNEKQREIQRALVERET